jgi:hypothetical protein
MAHDIAAIGPTQWGAQVNYDLWTPDPTPIRDAFLHWPGTKQTFEGLRSESDAALRGYESYHLNHPRLRFRGLAYDYSVDLSGRVYRIRGHARSAATSGDLSENGIPNNRESEAILLLIGPGQKMSLPMTRKVTELLEHWDVLPYGHNEAKGIATACPGPNVSEFAVVYRHSHKDVPPPPSAPRSPRVPCRRGGG